MLGNYLTSSTGVTVVFESAIVPKWGFAGGGSKILFKNVYISRGGNGEADSLVILPPVKAEDEGKEWIATEISKWTHFHLSIDTVEVSLDMSRWLDGKGLVKDASVTGVRGVVGESRTDECTASVIPDPLCLVQIAPTCIMILMRSSIEWRIVMYLDQEISG